MVCIKGRERMETLIASWKAGTVHVDFLDAGHFQRIQSEQTWQAGEHPHREAMVVADMLAI